MIKIKRMYFNVFNVRLISSWSVSHNILSLPLLPPRLLPLPIFPPPFTPPQVQARKHQTKFWINCLIIPYNITVTPNLANTHQHTLIHTSAAYPLWYLWDVADKWQRCLSANPEPLAWLGVCACVFMCVAGGEKKSLRDTGRRRGVLASFLLSDWLKWTSCRVMDFLTGKIVCFDHVAQQTMKNSILPFCTSTHQVLMLVKSVIWPFIDFPGGVQEHGKTAAHEKRRRRKWKNKEGLNFLSKHGWWLVHLRHT